MPELLLLQRLKLLPESGLSGRIRSVLSLLDETHGTYVRNILYGATTVTYLQLFHAILNTGGVDSRRVERLPEMNHGPRRLHHRVLLVMVDQIGQAFELFAAADVVSIVLE